MTTTPNLKTCTIDAETATQDQLFMWTSDELRICEKLPAAFLDFIIARQKEIYTPHYLSWLIANIPPFLHASVAPSYDHGQELRLDFKSWIVELKAFEGCKT